MLWSHTCGREYHTITADIKPEAYEQEEFYMHADCWYKLFRSSSVRTDVDDALFLIDGAHLLKDAALLHGLDFKYEHHGNRNSVEHVFQEIKHRASSFLNCFSNAVAETADDWLRTFAFAWNQLI